MAVVNTLIGHIKGPKGDTGETGATGATGAAGADATVSVGSTTTVPYGQAARVTNTGTPGAAVFNFTIPQGKPGEQTTKLDALTLDALTEPSTDFPVPAIGDNGSTLFGKISKWFSDMSALVATKLNTANVVNNLTTTSSGYALDARQGKALNDKFEYTNYTGSMVMNVQTYTARFLVRFQRTVTFELVLPSISSGTLNVCKLPSATIPSMQVSLAVSTERAVDRVGRQEAFVNANGDVFIVRDNASGGNIAITGTWFMAQ